MDATESPKDLTSLVCIDGEPTASAIEVFLCALVEQSQQSITHLAPIGLHARCIVVWITEV